MKIKKVEIKDYKAFYGLNEFNVEGKNLFSYSVPDSFTHGTAAQRTYWFRKGMQTGDIRLGDTFNDPSLN